MISIFLLGNWDLKTTYYLRTLGASQIEKSTLDTKKFGFTQKRDYKTEQVAAEGFGAATETTLEDGLPQACSIQNPECETCQ